jgi:hypothetical protein
MATLIEKDSSGSAALLLFLVALFLVAGGAWFAYTNVTFAGRATGVENNPTVIRSAPSGAPEAPKP